MRGKPGKLSLLSQRRRITPADAGKTKRSGACRLSGQDHPRGCGENTQICRFDDVNEGSPPRMRGKPRWSSGVDAARRITPADAGKTLVTDGDAAAKDDHPRGCGENSLNGIFSATGLGSPPRMRGKLIQLATGLGKTGITPADAGKTHCAPRANRSREDHPRGCGENASMRVSSSRWPGSPPRMRGKLFGFRPQKSQRRITPADAGKTILRIVFLSKKKDHPRGCGENLG